MNSIDRRTPHNPITLEVRDAGARGLSTSFVWHVDRYAHTIGLVDAGRLVPLLASVEGTDDDPWPVSPPLQTLTVEERPGRGRTILLVGMAGRSHWSMSATATGGVPSSDPPAIVFDVACRLHQYGDALESGYRSMVTAAIEQAGQMARFDLSGYGCQLEMLSVDNATATLQTTDTGLSIVVPCSTESSPTTIRWKYRVVLVDRRS